MATRTVTTLPVTELPVADGNWDTTRSPIDRVIIHTMVGTTASAASRFNTKNQAAAHYGVSLDGSIVHWVDENNTAYHAGDYPMNQRSIGIEHEDNGDYNGPRTDALYTASARLVKDICTFYNIPINRDHIKKHSEVSDSPTGCPDALDIDRIVREASGINQPQPQPQPQVQLGIPQADVIGAIYNGILGTDPSQDEITSRINQLNNGEILHNIVSQVLNKDSRSPLVKANNKIDDLTSTNNQQVNMLSDLNKQLRDCQNRPTKAPKTSAEAFNLWLSLLFHKT